MTETIPEDDLPRRKIDEKWSVSFEDLCKAEWPGGRSAGAAARQLCRTLGAHGIAPTLRRMLDALTSASNRAAFDRSCILRAFDDAAPEEAAMARRESYARNNPNAAAAAIAKHGGRS